MRLIRATAEFALYGQSFEGFPLLFDNQMELVLPAHHFFVNYLLQRGTVTSKKSWATYGQNLYDFFGFLEAHRLSWRETESANGYSIVAAYRDWAVGNGNSNGVVNQRLSTVCAFYSFALSMHWVSSLPFTLKESSIPRQYAAANRAGPSVTATKSPDVKLRQHVQPLKFLTLDQIRFVMRNVRNPTHKMMIRMGLQIGLRREEIATIPLQYVLDPGLQRIGKRQIILDLDPRDMALKGRRARQVYVSRELMRDLYFYTIHDRPRMANLQNPQSERLFLTEFGKPWSEDGKGFDKILKRIGRAGGFRLGAHALRHSYATYTLHAFLQSRDRIDPLIFLQRQLGHSSVSTTMRYLHLVNSLAEDAVLQFDKQITDISRES